jgi:hypothetical protein
VVVYVIPVRRHRRVEVQAQPRQKVPNTFRKIKSERAQVVEHLPSKCKAELKPHYYPSPHKKVCDTSRVCPLKKT